MVEIDVFLEGRIISDINYNYPVKLNIKKSSLASHTPHPLDLPTLQFNFCNFKSITFGIDEDIESKISILFFGCKLKNIDDNKLISKNISFGFGSCVVENLTMHRGIVRTFTFNNCLGVFAITATPQVSVSYSEENIFVNLWKKLDYLNTINEKTMYLLKNIEKINFDTKEIKKRTSRFYHTEFETSKYLKLKYLLSKKEKEQLKISINISYSADFAHKSTTINGGYLRAISLTGYPKGEIKIEKIQTNAIYIRGFSVEGFLKLFDISAYGEDSKFEIHDSNLDNSWFDKVDISSFSKMALYRSTLINTKLTSVIFPSVKKMHIQSIENIHYTDDKHSTYHLDQYENFLQLKKAFEKTGNIHEAQKMQSVAYKSLSKITDLNWWDKRILFLNNFSNSHGISVKKPLILLLIFSVCLYLLYLNALGYINLQHKFDIDLIGYYFAFLDITHRSDFLVEKENLTGFAVGIDFFSKILTGYFIYQFVAAFRKYGK